jgi:hypothetical protein
MDGYIIDLRRNRMHKNTSRPLGIGLVTLAALARLVPHVPNFTPVGGLSLFAGGRLRGWQAYLLPLVLMAATDPLVGGYSFATPFVYASFLINVWIGSRFLRATASPWRIGGAAAVGSLQFFLITNFAVWLRFGTAYPHTLNGLAACYVAAIPFYGYTLAGDLLYTGALFGLHAWLTRRVSTGERLAVQTA